MKKIQIISIILAMALLPMLFAPVFADEPAMAVDPTVVYGAHTPDGQHPVHGSERRLQSAKAAVLYEITSDTLVYTWNADAKLDPSSLTKIMTALLAVEQGDLSETVTVSWRTLELVPSNAVIAGLYNEEQVTLEQLLYLMMTGSANDAACIIAEHIAGSQEAFVNMMNVRAQELGCTGTVFMNAHGIHEDGQSTTARDMVKILRKALEYSVFYDVFCTESYTLEATNVSDVRYFESTNYMGSDVLTDQYYDSRVTGGRTGNTEDGRRNLAALAEEDGSMYISVVLGAESVYAENGVMTRQGAFEDTGILLDLGFQECSTVQVIYAGQILDQLPVSGGDSDVVVGPKETVSCVVPKDMDKSLLTTQLQLLVTDLSAPLEAGTYVGDYQVYYGSMCIAHAPVYTTHAVRPVSVTQEPQQPQDETPLLDPGTLTTALIVLGVIFLVILLVIGIRFLLLWFRMFQGNNRRQQRRSQRRRSR